jgi:hypothetical protein
MPFLFYVRFFQANDSLIYSDQKLIVLLVGRLTGAFMLAGTFLNN